MITRFQFIDYVRKIVRSDLDSQESIDYRCHWVKVNERTSIDVYFFKDPHSETYRFTWNVDTLPDEGDYFYRRIQVKLEFWLPWDSCPFMVNLLYQIEEDDMLCHALLEEIWERYPQDIDPDSIEG